MREHDLIRRLAESFPRDGTLKTGLFECDAEIVRMDERLWGMSMDEFSAEEDMFDSADPVRLGSNLAVATISDLFAAGVEPRLFMHSVCLPKTAEPDFVHGLMAGIQEILGALDCVMCGGDVGVADPWRYCGFCMGPVSSGRPLTRRLPPEPQELWVTGTLGDANIAAFQRSRTPAFELRNQAAALIRSHATGCIDTSGGFFDGLWLLHALNPCLRLDVQLGSVPIAEGIGRAAERAGFPMEAALLGGAGEYELMFAIPECPSAGNMFLPAGATRIGTVREDPEPGVFLRLRDGSTLLMSEPPPCPRSAASIDEHVREVLETAHRMFGTGKR